MTLINGRMADHRCPWTLLAYPGTDAEALVRCAMWRGHGDSESARHSSLSGFEWSQNDRLAWNPEAGGRDSEEWIDALDGVA